MNTSYFSFMENSKCFFPPFSVKLSRVRHLFKKPVNSKKGAVCKACHESKTWWWTGREYICDLCHAEEDGQHDAKIVAAAKKIKAYWVKREVMLTKRGKKKKELEEPEFF